MSKRLEHSEDMKNWNTVAAWEDSEVEKKWAKLQEWIKSYQPYGFFRAVDDPRTVQEIIEEATALLK